MFVTEMTFVYSLGCEDTSGYRSINYKDIFTAFLLLLVGAAAALTEQFRRKVKQQFIHGARTQQGTMQIYAGLDQHFVAVTHQFTHPGRRHANPVLVVFYLFWNPY